MSMIPGGADASVSIKVDVDDAGAQARIAALETRLKALEKQFSGTGKGAQNYGKQLDDVSKKAGSSDKSQKNLMKSGQALGQMFGRLGKFAKFAGIELAVLTAGLGAMKLALWAGQTAMKGFHALLRATGAAAGVAVGAIATVLAALREVQSVKLAPILGGIGNAKTQTNAFFADRRFAMFDQKTMASIMQSAAEQGQVIDATFRNQLANLANYSLGDPKKLAEMQKTFQQIQKDGKVTAQTYAQLQTSSPALAKAFDEMAGGTKKGEAAAKSGAVTYKKFFDAVQEGKLKALEPFQGALENINDTLMARFKGSVMGVKEQLTRMGEPLLQGFKRPLTIIEREISLFILKINGTVGKVFPTLFDVKDNNNNSITRMFDKLASSINTNMGKISGWITSFQSWGRSVRSWFGDTGDMLAKFSRGWDKLYNKILKPIGVEVVKTLGHLFEQFNKTIDSAPLNSFETAIGNIGEIIRNLITGFAQLKVVMAPIVTSFLSIASAISKITSIPGLQTILPLLLMGKLMGGRGKVLNTQTDAAGNVIGRTLKGGGGMGGVGMGASMFMAGGMGGGGILGSLMMPLMMGMSGFGMNTRAGAASAGNYASNRAIGAGRIPSALLSSGLGFGLAQNLRGGMGVRDSMHLAGSGARGAMTDGFTNRKGDIIQGSVATTRQARIDALMANRQAMLARTKGAMGQETFSDYVKRSGFTKKGKSYFNQYGAKFTQSEMESLHSRENAVGRRQGIKSNRAGNAQQIRAEKLQAIATGKVQGKEAGKAFVRDAGAKFGKAAGAMGATIGLTMIGGMIQQNAGTNKTMAGLGGAMSGAGMGMSMGAAFGPAGMVAGALIGGGLGFLSGRSNAQKQKEANEDQARNYVQENVFGNKTFNRSEDFAAARANVARLQLNLAKVGEGPNSLTAQIAEIGAREAEIPQSTRLGVEAKARAKFGTSGDIYQNSAAMKFMTEEIMKMGSFTNDQLDEMFGDDGVISNLEDMAYATEGVYKYGIGEAEQKLKASLEAERKALIDSMGDTDIMSEELAASLREIADREKVYDEMIGKTMHTLDGTGVTASQVASLFDELGYSIEETSVGIHEFNTLIGMTGDVAADIANGAGRLGRTLLTQTQKDMAVAESRSRLQQQLETMFAVKGSVGASEGTRVAGETLNEVVGNAMSELAAGNYTFEQMLGKTGESGLLQNQLYTLVMNSFKGNVSQDVIDQLARSIFGDPNKPGTGMLADLERAKTDPFARAQYDAVFNQGFTGKIDELTKILGGKIAGGADPVSALNEGMVDLEKYLTDQGIKLDPAAEEKLKNILGSTLLNTPTAMAEAMRSAGADVAAMIRSAMTGGPDPALFELDPTKDVPGANPYAIGDTTSSRFARTMSSHASLNSMVPGKRTVTSGVRNTMLGSMGSDHATGAAYDLVGDNLVSYANNVKTAGGFAEFHGGTADKHLHVVPPVGDTTSSRSVGYASGGSGSSINNYNFEINGGDGANAQEIADAVMDRIARAERNRRERS